MAQLCLGHYTRGAITVGLLHHRQNVVFGPALIDVYRLESQVAKYPRVLVTEQARPYVDPLIFLDDKPTTHFRNLCEDLDGLVYVDILGFGAGRKDEVRRLRGVEEKLIEQVSERANQHRDDLRLLAKDLWMLRYLKEVVAESQE